MRSKGAKRAHRSARLVSSALCLLQCVRCESCALQPTGQRTPLAVFSAVSEVPNPAFRWGISATADCGAVRCAFAVGCALSPTSALPGPANTLTSLQIGVYKHRHDNGPKSWAYTVGGRRSCCMPRPAARRHHRGAGRHSAAAEVPLAPRDPKGAARRRRGLPTSEARRRRERAPAGGRAQCNPQGMPTQRREQQARRARGRAAARRPWHAGQGIECRRRRQVLWEKPFHRHLGMATWVACCEPKAHKAESLGLRRRGESARPMHGAAGRAKRGGRWRAGQRSPCGRVLGIEATLDGGRGRRRKVNEQKWLL
jgi:hypothetical protein